MSPPVDTEFTLKKTPLRNNRKGKSEFILDTGSLQERKSIDELNSYDAAGLFGALSFDEIHFCLVFLYSSMLLLYVNLVPSFLKIFKILLTNVLK